MGEGHRQALETTERATPQRIKGTVLHEARLASILEGVYYETSVLPEVFFGTDSLISWITRAMHDPVKTSSLHAFFEVNASLGTADVVL